MFLLASHCLIIFRPRVQRAVKLQARVEVYSFARRCFLFKRIRRSHNQTARLEESRFVLDCFVNFIAQTVHWIPSSHVINCIDPLFFCHHLLQTSFLQSFFIVVFECNFGELLVVPRVSRFFATFQIVLFLEVDFLLSKFSLDELFAFGPLVPFKFCDWF